MRKGKARVMKDFHAREHALSGVHQRFSKAASREPVRTQSLAGSDIMWRSVKLVRIDPLDHS
jgi:hypothetical protein